MSTETITAHRTATVSRHPALTPMAVVGRRVLRGALIWGAVLGLTAWELVAEFGNEYPTADDRAMLVRTMAQNVGWQALFGPARHLDTVAGYTTAHLIGVFGLVVAMWGLLAGTRLLRGEEDAGRTEVLLAGPTTRRRVAAAEVAGLGVGLFVAWAVVAGILVAVGRSRDAQFTVTASLFTAVAALAAAAMFLAVGALCSQVAATRRQAVVLAAGVFGIAYLLRVVAYSGSTLRWMRWLSPLSWVDELQPLTGSRPLLLTPIAGFITAVVAATIILAGRRDLGASVLPAHDTAAARTRLLSSPLGLACRLNLRIALGWAVGLGIGGLLFGSLTKTSEDVWKNASGGVIGKLGGANGGAAYLGIAFLLVALLIATAAAGQVSATREEEAEGYLDHLLARPVARMRWLAGRFTVAALMLATLTAFTGLATWVGAVSTGADERIGTLLAAGINAAPAGILVLGIGTLLHALAPRLAVALCYGVVAWSFLVEIIGASLGISRWLLDTSILHHIARAPAETVRWDSAGILVALGVLAAVAGAAAFARRDLTGA